MLACIKEVIKQEQFFPSFFGLFVNPFYFARKGLVSNIVKFALQIRGKVLDVGCGCKPYERIFLLADNYVGLEYDSDNNRKTKKKADAFYDGKKFPFADCEFDAVLFFQVFEHVFNPHEFLSEVWRVLKPNGCILLTAPFIWDEHEQPHDYARYSSYGLMSLVTESGFEIIEHYKTSNDITAIFQLINAYIYKKIHTNYPSFNLLLTILLISPINITGQLASKILPKNNDLYLDNVVLARKSL